jgi:cation diffusion facilitator CzcD-associated flavoprotein CzcO
MVSASPPTVAVIGGGPGGMFFCHALETRRRELKEQGDEAALASLPIVAVFERASGPGGVWRAERKFGKDENKDPDPTESVNDDNNKKGAPSETTNMYEALWTNGSKENIEFYDYTFDEHFGRPLPVYMPRQPILEYMIGRVTKHCPDFFEKYIQFNTSVVSVRFIHDKFEFVTKNHVTQEETTGVYDKCVWAAGENGRPIMPYEMVQMFRDGGFTGRIIHSSDTANFEEDVKGKRILLIGGSYSAEDLALMAVKVGVEKVYVSSRWKENAVSWTTAWPQDKVEILSEQTPVRITEDGKCIQFAEVEWTIPDKYVPSEEVETEIRDIDTIIFCTGYKPNVGMLEQTLQVPFSNDDKTLKLSVPKDWKMKPNKLTEYLGEVEPGDVYSSNSIVSYPGLYRGLAISNPAMMFLTGTTDNPLVCIDVNACLLLRFITGLNAIPTSEVMTRQNLNDAFEGMQNIYVRYCMDSNYCAAFDEKCDNNKKLRELILPFFEEHESEHYSLYFRMLARTMQEAKYPVSFGTFEEFNEIAKTVMSNDTLVYNHRIVLDPDNEDENTWRTFRDYADANKFRSIFTGTEAVPLPGRWIDLDATDATIV